MLKLLLQFTVTVVLYYQYKKQVIFFILNLETVVAKGIAAVKQSAVECITLY